MPTHAREVWSFQLTNQTAPWTLFTWSGRPITADPVQLLDDASLEWGLTEDQFPADLEPSTASCLIGAPSAAELPQLTIGDRVLVVLARRDAANVTHKWHEFYGRIADVILDGDPHRDPFAIVARVYLADLVAATEENRYAGRRDQSWDYWVWGPYDRLVDLAGKCKINLAIPNTFYYSAYAAGIPPDGIQQGSVDPRGRTARELMEEILATCPRQGHRWILRETVNWSPSTATHRVHRGDPTNPAIYTFMAVPSTASTYLIRQKLTRAGAGLPVEYFTDESADFDTDMIGKECAVPAGAIPGRIELRRDRRDRITDLQFTGAPLDDDNGEARTVTYSPIAGASRTTRTVQGSAYFAEGLSDASPLDPAYYCIAAHRPWMRTAGGWRLPDTTIETDLLTDEQLDDLTNTLTLKRPFASVSPLAQLPVLTIYDAAPSIRPNGRTLTGTVCRVRFQLRGGKLSIVVRTLPQVMALYSSPNAQTWAGFKYFPGGVPTLAQFNDITIADMRLAQAG